MDQADFFAEQENPHSSQQHVFEHLSHLQHLNTQNILNAFRQRQEASLAPLRQGQFTPSTADDCVEYFTDLAQRTLLFWDTLRQRGDNTLAHERAGYPLLLKFEHETLMAGTDLPRPVNYSLLRILPSPEQKIDSTRRPVIIIDPRGGHGSGIGGFKQDSEIGESLRAGHPTYFIAFSHSPQPGQTLDDIAKAQAHFIEIVSALHPSSDKPILIGNCQAGWALMGVAATRPELPGLVIINGAPLSYWAGVNGRNPMRYAAGLLGGAWMTRLGSDLGNGRFDGTWLVSNFENLDPANTYWGKYYHLFRDVDSEAPRFLDFERWWGSPTLLNGEEIEMIVDDLFIGNHLSGGLGRKSIGLDLKQIEVPVVVFCSYGDNITSPQQALDWIADVYPSDLALRSAGRTIVYLQHASIGHLGIFVSGKVARREHRELLGAVGAINALAPGLYELLIDDLPDSSGSDSPKYSVRFEPRRIADIHGDKGPTRDDDSEFALVERTSEVNSTLYEWFVRPWMRQAINEPTAELMRKAHPFHQQQVAWSSLNPTLWWLAGTADQVRGDRRPARKSNPLLVWQDLFSNQTQDALNAYRDIRDATQELCFYGVYSGLSALTDTHPDTPA
ncbi:MAG: poly(3-hydroxyalkanoate) synthetase [Pseudomonas sp.]|nr:poly(3-hydroxyalkanoate) synthetase [Pseudomonas sp.]